MGKGLGIRLTGILIVLSVLFGLAACVSDTGTNTVWPGETWQRSTPEAQGVDSEILMKVLKILKLDRSGINSMVIIRNGYIIAEYYRQPFSKDTVHRINSCTKSFTSTLMGIAIDQGLVKSVDEPVMPYFPDYSHDDPRVYDITIEDLLTMRSGFEWHNFDLDSFHDSRNDGRLYQSQEDYIEYLFSKPLVERPGTVFNYNSMNSQLLAEIIHFETGGDSAEFLEEELLKPLGISSWYVRRVPTGSFSGGTGMGMSTEDLARLGYLYLNNGVWKGRRIVSKRWIQDSVSPYTSIISRGRTQNEKYGYQWWVLNENCYAAEGGVGQRCFVLPENNTVIAVNSSFVGWQDHILDTAIRRDFAYAIAGEEPLLPNPAAVESLHSYLENVSKPMPSEIISNIEPIREKLNGRTIEFESNDAGYRKMRISFNGTEELYIDLEKKGIDDRNAHVRFLFDLDGSFRRNLFSLQREGFYGDSSNENFYRITSIRDNSISYEVIISGDLKLWYTVTLYFDGSDVRGELFRKAYGAKESHLYSFSGEFVK